MRAPVPRILSVALVALGCEGTPASDAPSWAHDLSPLEDLPPDPTNAYADDPDAAALGQKLFFETAWAGPIIATDAYPSGPPEGYLSCASCHLREAFDDPATDRPINVALGADWHPHNASPLVNASLYEWGGWAGRFDSQWSTPLVVFEAKAVFNSSRLRVMHVVLDKYRDEYRRVFGELDPGLEGLPDEGKPKPSPTPDVPNPPDGEWEAIDASMRERVDRVFVNVGKALAAYCRLLTSGNSPFDRFVAGDRSAISRAAVRGLELFGGKAGCISCHSGPHFSDDDFHNIGVPQTGEHVLPTDDGRAAVLGALLGSVWNGEGPYSDDPASGRAKLDQVRDLTQEETLGTFRTKSLRQIAQTAPYMHAGQFATLRDVLESYNHAHGDPVIGVQDPSIVPLNLTDGEIDDLIEFLTTLTGAPIPTELTEPPP